MEETLETYMIKTAEYCCGRSPTSCDRAYDADVMRVRFTHVCGMSLGGG